MFTAGDLETIEVIDPGGRDRFGDRAAAGDPVPVHGCLFAPTTSTEDHVNASQVDTFGTVYCPPGTEVSAQHQVRVRGLLYEVNGEPELWGQAGLVVPLRKVTG